MGRHAPSPGKDGVTRTTEERSNVLGGVPSPLARQVLRFAARQIIFKDGGISYLKRFWAEYHLEIEGLYAADTAELGHGKWQDEASTVSLKASGSVRRECSDCP